MNHEVCYKITMQLYTPLSASQLFFYRKSEPGETSKMEVFRCLQRKFDLRSFTELKMHLCTV